MRWRKKKDPPEPAWVLAVDSCAWIDDGEEEIEEVVVKFTKPGWSWTILREDLPYGPMAVQSSRIWDMGPADTREEALEIGLAKMREYQNA